MSQTKRERNKALVLDAFDTLFNKRDYVAAERYWSPTYIQHSAHIAPGREGLFNLIKSMPTTLKYEPAVIVADGNLVVVHGRFSGFGAPVNWIATALSPASDRRHAPSIAKSLKTNSKGVHRIPAWPRTMPRSAAASISMAALRGPIDAMRWRTGGSVLWQR